MCHYRVTTYRCGHKRKLPIPPCHSRPSCGVAHDLAELSHDLGDVRAGIRMNNLHQGNLPGYQQLLGRLRRNYGSYFGHGSANGARLIDSLRQLETYLAHEIDGVATNVTVRDRSDEFYFDSCWEGMLAIGREEQYRRGYFRGSHGG